jgi:hypothetical protein
VYAIVPQVIVPHAGVVIYRLDANVRHSTVIGIVGAGGIGQTLSASFSRYDFDFSCAILLSIVALVAVGEWFSDWVRRRIAMTDTSLALRYPERWLQANARREPGRLALDAGGRRGAVWSVSALEIEWAFFADAHEQAADLAGADVAAALVVPADHPQSA